MNDIYPINSEQIELAKNLHCYLRKIDKKYGSPVIVGRKDMIDGTFEILTGIMPLAGCEYSYEVNHKAFAGYYSTIYLTRGGDKYSFSRVDASATEDDISVGLCSKGGVMTIEKIWQVYLFATIYRIFQGAEWNRALPVYELADLIEQYGKSAKDYMPMIIYNPTANLCTIMCHWWYQNLPLELALRLEFASYRIFPYRTKRISTAQKILEV